MVVFRILLFSASKLSHRLGRQQNRCWIGYGNTTHICYMMMICYVHVFYNVTCQQLIWLLLSVCYLIINIPMVVFPGGLGTAFTMWQCPFGSAGEFLGSSNGASAWRVWGLSVYSDRIGESDDLLGGVTRSLSHLSGLHGIPGCLFSVSQTGLKLK